ncbi:ewing's tumor-associated antigen 1 isoform X2 [Chelmon rostratus]|uniref:ewing's tumor-associated antigen 1 isoform X2 n=1 Tax=Chelmon rostratus TaxID=109905 RepID=UPI001BED30E5|nr:ewing's tumor-associated antigen 1 isoform X2 [Chelmon rostratus]
MNRGRRKFDPPSGLTGSPLHQQTATSKPNRLSRTFRQSQQTKTAAQIDSPNSQQSDFKTPTRIPRSRAGGGFSEESPHNDSDFQQDIIWDATSPSPNRLGKRGKKQRAGVVDISEIVNRIAPKHGRPENAEPTLQQWIGDSATIPCTPDAQVPKPKKKSPRPNAVDDLLKLAKQFDFNMFRQDEEVEDLHQQSLELLSEDILDLENSENDVSSSLPGNFQPAGKAAAAADVQVHLDQHMEDDLDFLFDGPTQHVSGNLSQVSSQVKPASDGSSKEASGKLSSSLHGSTCSVSTTNTKGTLVNQEFEDDWENDDLLNDSLVLEMTQNPQSFSAPKHCSTQKPSSEIKYQRPVNVPTSESVGLSQSAASKVEKDNVRQRTTFKLESNPNFSARRIQTDTWTKSKVDFSSETAVKDNHQSRFSAGRGVVVKAGSQSTCQTSNMVKSDLQKPQFHHRTSVGGSYAKHNTTASAASNTSATETAASFPQRPAVVSSHHEAPAGADLLDEDLYSFFLSDPVWDDPADDDLLCEMCEDVENQMQRVENVSTKQTVSHISNQRAALQPASRTWDNRNQPANQQPFPQKQTPATLPCASARAGSSLAGGSVSNFTAGAQMNAGPDSFRFTQAKNVSGPTKSSACVQGSSRVQSAAQGKTHKDQFTFKKPNSPVSTGGSKAVSKCSAAEIELKKQQAMERRRQRLQAAQNLRAPT